MNTYLKQRSLLVVCLLVSSLSAGNLAAETIRLANGEWPPYFSEQLQHYGIGSRLVAEAFALEGITVEYEFYPWKRGLTMAEGGDLDGAVGWQTNPEREVLFYASDTVWEAPWVFFHLKTLAFDWQTFGDLKAYQIGGTIEYMYTEEFLNAERNGVIQVDRVPSDEQNFKKLAAGRIDIFPQLLDIGYYQIQTLFPPETAELLTHHPTSFGMHAEQLLLSRKIARNKESIAIFNRGLQKLKDSGKYDRYLEESRHGAYLK